MLIRSLIIAAVVFIIACVLGSLIPREFSIALLEGLGETIDPLGSLNPFLFLLIIILNNILKALGAIVLGILLALPTLFFIFVNGIVLGAVLPVIASEQGWGLVVASILPHGVIEIPMLLLATALGLMIGWESLRWLSGRRGTFMTRFKYGLKMYLIIVLPGLVIAAVIESFVTPLIIKLVAG